MDESCGSDYDQFEDSERVDSSDKKKHHRRSISDPHLVEKDDTVGDVFMDAVSQHSTSQQKSSIVDTMPRYPVMDTRNKNCFSEPPVSIFHVRGPSYFRDKKKTKSGPYLLRARGCDLLLADNNGECVLNQRWVG